MIAILNTNKGYYILTDDESPLVGPIPTRDEVAKILCRDYGFIPDTQTQTR